MTKKEIKLHYETVSPLLRKTFNDIMAESIFDPFYLVGGTSLSLRLGHRKSVDIDLFTNAPYGSLDFTIFEKFFQQNYKYYYCTDKTNLVSFGRSYYIGKAENNNVKVDLYYHDEIRDPCDVVDGIRIASLADITYIKREKRNRSSDYPRNEADH